MSERPAPARRLDFGSRRLRALGSSMEHEHRGALARQRPSSHKPKAAAGAGDDGAFALEQPYGAQHAQDAQL